MPPENVHKTELRLYGDKIRLTERPSEFSGKASARCSLLGGTNRPMSVVPILDLYKMDQIEITTKKRPLSANVPLHYNFTIRSEKPTSSSSNEEDFGTDNEIDKEQLPLESGKLFKFLLDEPITSWKGGIRTESRRKKLIKKATKSRNDTGSSTENSERNECNSSLRLIPDGLATKPPPIPKKIVNRERKHRISLIPEELEEDDNKKKPHKVQECLYQNWVSEPKINDKGNKSKPKLLKSITTDQKDTDNEIKTLISLEEEQCNVQSNYFDCLSKVEELHSEININLDEIDIKFEDLDSNDTYDEIVSILQVLEDQDKKSQSSMNSIREIVTHELANSNEKEIDKETIVVINDIRESIPKLLIPVEKLEQKPNQQEENQSENLSNILSFLDEVDKRCIKDFHSKTDIIIPKLDTTLHLDTIPKLEELINYSQNELATNIIDLCLRLKDKSSSIALLQNELSTLRQQVTKMNKESDEVVKKKLKSQKEEYETVVKRHQKFIDQLIADKKTLNKQCESLIHEIKVLEDRYTSNMQAAEHRHKIELQKLKDMHVASEKIKRNKWIDNKTQKIKELTVKGLEPELERMTTRHQEEMANLRTLHKKEIEEMEVRAARKSQQQCEAIREQLIGEREKIIAHETELLRQRHEQLMAMEEQNYQEQRRKLQSDHAMRMAECEEREKLAIIDRDKKIKMIEDEYGEKLQESLRRQNNEIRLLKEQMELEMETFRNNYKKQVMIQLGQKESEIKEKCRKERDQEIETVIERLEGELGEIKAQIEDSCENRIRRLKTKYELEIKDLETSEKDSSNKYTEIKGKLLKSEDEVISLRATIKHLESNLQETQSNLDKLDGQKKNMLQIVREELKEEITSLEKELKEVKSEKEKELQQVYSRVRIAVARKDEALSEITRDYQASKEKCLYLESMLEQQRKEYFMKSL